MAAMAVSCVNELTGEERFDGPGLELNMSTVDLALLGKATEPGVDAGNENVIKTIDFFLYPEGATGSNAMLKGHLTPNVSNKHTYRVSLSDSQLEELFPTSKRRCDVLIIANWPSNLSSESNTSVEALKAQVIASNFVSSDVQSSFAMVGEAKANLVSRNKTIAATADIPLRRLACRLTLDISSIRQYDEEVKDTEGNPTGEHVLWTSAPDRMGVVFYHARNKADVAGNTATFDGINEARFNYGTYTNSSFSPARSVTGSTIRNTGAKAAGLDESYSNKYECRRFYTYPTRWNTRDEYEPYILIMMPWSYTDGTGTHYKSFYYKVFLTGNHCTMNTWYHMSIRLSLLGSLTPNRPTVVLPEDLTYYVADWRNCLVGGAEPGTGDNPHNVEAEIRDARYLVVERNTYEMHNENVLHIPYNTSHDCSIAGRTYNYNSSSKELTWNDDWNASITPVPFRKDFSQNVVGCSFTSTNGGFSISIDKSTKHIIVSHELSNETKDTKNYDYAPYTVTFRIQHTDAADYYQQITVIQYPALYINAKLDPQGHPENGTAALYTFVNGGDNTGSSAQGANGTTNHVGTNPTTNSRFGNTNGNMYIITTTVLPQNSEYILGDPRKKDTDNLTTGWASWSKDNVPSVQGEGENRTLEYYYPTSTDLNDKFILAPKFRIASSWGVTYELRYSNAQRRCASYQEAGRPAGRWRIPTRAEVEYIAKLSGDGKIPKLLSDGTEYWCATGTVMPTTSGTVAVDFNNGDTSGSHSVRCVYDEWFWEKHQCDTVKWNTFTWGDYVR